MKYDKFIKEGRRSENYKFGCVMIELGIPNWNEITSLINKEDIYSPKGDNTHGLETDPHITILWGVASRYKRF